MDEVLAIDIGGTKTNISFVKTEDSDIKISQICFKLFPVCNICWSWDCPA